jgi:hypothetical protein
VLRVVVDLDELETEGLTRAQALDLMQTRVGVYDPHLLQALREQSGVSAAQVQIREMRLVDVREGMIFDAEVRNERGILLVARGQEVTASVIERIRNHWWTYAGSTRVRMVLRTESTEQMDEPTPTDVGNLAAEAL